MRMHSSRPLKTLPSCKLVNRPRSASISIDRPAVLRLRKVGSSASIPSWPDRWTRAFQIRLELFVLSFCQFSRDSFSPLGIEESHILVIDPLALLCRRIRARSVEIPILHEVVICVAAARFSPARKPRVAVRHQSTALVIRWGVGLD